MQIVREKPCQRLHHRVTAPLEVTLEDGVVLVAANWSLGGLRLDDVPGSLPQAGDVLSLLLRLPFQGFDISFPVKAEVVRTVSETSTIGAKFIELGERANDLMSHFIEDLIRGKMATVDDTICRIDVPVTPISTEPDANPISEVPRRRLPWKTIFMSCFYIALGIGVFLYLFVLVFTQVTKMEVTSAVVSAPLVHLSMPVDGQVIPIMLKSGMNVQRGQKLARVVDSQVDARISDLKIEVENDRRNLLRAHERLRIETDRMRLYQMVKRTNLEVARAQVDAAREALSSIDVQVERLTKLREKKLVKQSKVETVIKSRGEAEARLKAAEFELEKAAATQSGSGRGYFDAGEFVVDLDLLALEVEEANSNLVLTSERLEQLEVQRSGLEIIAPFDGRIVSADITYETHLSRGKKIVTIEKFEAPQITAFLDQEEVIHVGMRDEASVYVPALGKRFAATVQGIDRSAASLRVNASHYVWSGVKQKSASVSLELQVPEADRPFVHGGLPAVVVFSRRSTGGILAGFSNVFQDVGL